jgi:glycerate 2-kinase
VDAIDPTRLLREAHSHGVLARLRAPVSPLHGDSRNPRPVEASGTDAELRMPAVYLVAAGKAAWPMASAFLDLEPEAVRAGLIAGPRVGPHSLPAQLTWCDAAHPFPNAVSTDAGGRAIQIANEARREDARLVVLLSGGASAMLALPAAGVTIDDKISTARALMHAGLAIDQLNCVRKHLSAVKGGQLAAAARRTLTLAISDVHAPIADDPSVIGSGPTVPDPTTFAQALEIARRAAGVPRAVLDRLERGARGELPETIKPGDPRLSEATYEVIANRETALEGARQAAASLGYRVVVLEGPVTGESREAARAFVAQARQIAAAGSRPLCVLAAGETTVTVVGKGTGGRNQEFALAAAPALEPFGDAALVASLGTDGVDGPTDAGGAIVDSMTLARARRAGLDWESTLAANDAYHFFQPLGDLIAWGPTGTNVGDVQMLLLA